MEEPPLIKDILFDGNNLCLDFINTIHNRYATEPYDYLVDQSAWIEWLQKKGLILSGQVNEDSLFDLPKIRQLRELLYRVFYGIVHKKMMATKDVSAFNRHVLQFRKATKISIKNGIAVENIELNEKDLNSYLLPIIEQANHLLFFTEIKQIKECGNCGWLFLDTSKSKKRKWCNMKTCGNQVKARRHYQRSRQNLDRTHLLSGQKEPTP